jgi:predicted DNA-binding antitoxin AbrB/MazE fold protein
MAMTVEAIYENGALKLAQPLPLKEREKVRVTVEPETSPLVAGYGIMGWTGDAETIERIALSPEFDPNENA